MPTPSIHGTGLDGQPIVQNLAKGVLGQAFVVPPFSVLNAREGAWQARKKRWLELGIQSELGRGGNLLSLSDGCEEYRHRAGDYASPGRSARPAADYSNKERGDGAGRPLRKHTPSLKGGLVYGLTMQPYEGQKEKPVKRPKLGGLVDPTSSEPEEISAANSGTSIFDPVACELAYRWFCPKGGAVLDPFAGGSVRGIVAHALGRRYRGVDLSKAQVAHNYAQADKIFGGRQKGLQWVCGDSLEVLPTWKQEYDSIFTCPPYGNLEVYSDDPADLSTMSEDDFASTYLQIIEAACDKLKEDRFASVVVGDYRRKDGTYTNFPGTTVQAFENAGLNLYNECILITAVGSLSIRTKKQFDNSRKLGKTHQNWLVFVKGDPVRATRMVQESEK